MTFCSKCGKEIIVAGNYCTICDHGTEPKVSSIGKTLPQKSTPHMSKIITILIIVSVLSTIVFAFNLMSQASNLQESNQAVIDSQRELNYASLAFLDACSTEITNSADLQRCFDGLTDTQNKCRGDLKDLSVCSDKRIKTFFDTYESRKAGLK